MRINHAARIFGYVLKTVLVESAVVKSCSINAGKHVFEIYQLN